MGLLVGDSPPDVRGVPRLDRVGEVLELVRSGRANRMSELATSMGVARSTVRPRVERLIEHGLLQARGEVLARQGRPPLVLEFNAAVGVVLVAHLGMTGARIAVADLAATVLGQVFIDLPPGVHPEGSFDVLEGAFDEVLAGAGRRRTEVRGIGIGLPSSIDLASFGRLEGRRVDHQLAHRLEAAFGVAVIMDRDVNLIALGEQRSSWPDAEVFLCVKVGTVIGCSVVVNGQVVRGAQSQSGEIGHSPVLGSGVPCLCGNTGCLDATASGRSLASALFAQGFATTHVRDVTRLARDGVPEAIAAVRAAGRDIGEVLAGAVNLLNPSAIALWGYLVEAEVPLLAGIRETIHQRSSPAASGALELSRTRTGESAGVQGAAMRVIGEILAPEAIDRMLATRLTPD